MTEKNQSVTTDHSIKFEPIEKRTTKLSDFYTDKGNPAKLPYCIFFHIDEDRGNKILRMIEDAMNAAEEAGGILHRKDDALSVDRAIDSIKNLEFDNVNELLYAVAVASSTFYDQMITTHIIPSVETRVAMEFTKQLIKGAFKEFQEVQKQQQPPTKKNDDLVN